MIKTRKSVMGIAALFFGVVATAFSRSPAANTTPHDPGQDAEWGIAVHGGAGTIDTLRMSPLERRLRRDALMRSLTAGHKIIAAGGSSLDAVQAAVIVLEDDSMFNAGKGTDLNAEGKNELDAEIMNGKTIK